MQRIRSQGKVCAAVLLVMTFATSHMGWAQAAGRHPDQSSQLAPDRKQDTPTFRVGTSVVLVPTLVEKPGGEVVYGLSSKDFTVEDNGVKQDARVEEELDVQPVSLVVAIERGRTSLLQFDKIAKLGPLLELFLGEGHGEAALVTFDSTPVYREGFTADTDVITQDLQNIEPGDGGAAILDAAGLAIDILEQQPVDHRRVLLLISESRDHGSKKVTVPQLVQRIGTSNTLVLSLTYSASKAEFLNDLKGGGSVGPTMNMLSPLMMAVAALRKNVSKGLAGMSGGEYAPFTRERGFEDRVAEVASHARNRYVLSFRPTDLTPGLHELRVKLNDDYGAKVVARTSYWAISQPGGAPAQPAATRPPSK
jgi:VWFA-related protein